MTPAESLALAKCVQLRDLIAILFHDDTPWGESPAVMALADLLEAKGHYEVAEAVRGRAYGDDFDWQLVEWDMRRSNPKDWLTLQAKFLNTKGRENPFRKKK